MNEDILPRGTLDKPVTLRPVEPLDCTLLSHRKTPFASALKLTLGAREIFLCTSRYTESPLRVNTCVWNAQKIIRDSRALRLMKSKPQRPRAPDNFAHFHCKTQSRPKYSTIAAPIQQRAKDNIRNLDLGNRRNC